MVDPKSIDINELQKRFIDGAVGGFAKGAFFFVLTSGKNVDASFATTPEVMKIVVNWMNTQVNNYEDQFGNIEIPPPPKV